MEMQGELSAKCYFDKSPMGISTGQLFREHNQPVSRVLDSQGPDLLKVDSWYFDLTNNTKKLFHHIL